MPRIKFVITGFSSFPGVASNPTEQLVAWIKTAFPSAAQVSGPEADITLQSATVLEVAAKAVDAWMDSFFEQLPEPASEEVLVLVHLGVNSKGQKIQLEAQAVNEATFRVPDEDGWQPVHCPIDPQQPLTCALTSDLDLAACCDWVHAEESCEVPISHDAGLYICNWTYYRSLQRTQPRPNAHSLFIHVPPFSVVDQTQQQVLLLSVLTGLAQGLAVAAPTVEAEVRNVVGPHESVPVPELVPA